MNAHYMKLLAGKLDGYCGSIKSRIYTVVGSLDAEAFVTKEPVPYRDRATGKRLALKKGDVWGGLWDCAWIHITGVVPDAVKDGELALLLDISGEALIVDENGDPVRGLTCVDSGFDRTCGLPGKKVYRPEVKAGRRIDFWMDAGNNDLFGAYQGGRVNMCDIAVCDENARRLYYDFVVLHDLMKVLPPDSPRYCSILYALNAAGEAVSDFNAQNVLKATRLLAKELDKKGGTPSLEFYATGHAHLDLAWLWPIRETKRKAARTFATALANMDKYPDYIFGQSQPQQFVWMKESYPTLYSRIKKRVTEGRLEPQGAMWVEADTNLSGAEALVRQLLYGKKFFINEFGKDIKILHLPDVFGYTAALPQILKKSGVEYFMTIKMSWSLNNTFPYHTFRWVGMDGSEVLVHLPPEGNYLSSALPRATINAAAKFMEKGIMDKALMLFGIGDGGGGPGAEHLESLSRIRNLEGAHPVRQAQTIDFFDAINKDRHKVKSYKGEMYLETHQGTYTTQAKSKYYNRLLEKLLRDAEIILSINLLYGTDGYPAEELEAIWKEVLLYQFHDILPGSSIKRVYDESVARYMEMETAVRGIIAKALGAGENYFNSLSWERTEIIERDGKYCLLVIPALGTASPRRANEINDMRVSATKSQLSNGLLSVRFNDAGAITSLTDGNGFEAISGEANVLNIYCDNNDAWNIDAEYMNMPVCRAALISAESFTDGACAVRKQVFKYNKSTFTQTIKLRYGGRYLEIENLVDWQENEKMFRIDGSFNVQSDKVVCDIQFGNIERSTLENNSLDFAQFEICAHKYIDLKNAGGGVALLNDCKYGYRAKGNLMSLNALRSTSYPGVDADRGAQRFRYALYPHSGPDNNVERLSYEFNFPVYRAARELVSPVTVDNKSIILEAMKMSESGEGVVIRLYNNKNACETAKITLNHGDYSVTLTDLTETPVSRLALENRETRLTFKPFEIHTILLKKLHG